MKLPMRVAAAATATGLALTLAVLAQAPSDQLARAATSHAHVGKSKLRSRPAIALRNAMRKLWEDHITWTRMYIVSALADLPDKDAAATRLLANQDDIGDATKPYYGDAAGEQLSSLLREHILIAVELLDAAKNGDGPAVEDANARWHPNADEIADFLSAANPKNWKKAEMRAMMADHLDRTLAEATARLSAHWEADVVAYDGIHQQILHMADMLSTGIIKQFPGRF